MAGPRSSDILIDELFATTTRLRGYVDAQLRAHGMSVARLRVLRTLARSPEPLRMRDLSDRLNIAARSATTLIDSLEREGLVTRLPHPSDRRAYLLALTDAGRSRHAEAEKVDQVALATATSGLDQADRARLRELLAALRASVPDAPPGPPPED
ncbi:MarR family winged helix-turn-helix transcriptional regulator [Allostreptomyces psammosilenae]|uniref:DNA-binding MarR family transcriptional regulator n=1 Tax=Allostreptomyces psammosilenae TaxID=1892865 RepID=A0A852ZU85_9ACTN|nr:MarR family transcriptional regulator [Allostreptomyces psammosilenae]NYI04850.1 DNA-binding MarR family transcriptional regulator [Allostreptomyces psammosilenae]